MFLFININSNTDNKTGAVPSLLGMAIMNIPKEAFVTIPALIQPLLSNGLLIGILVALLMEFITWSSKTYFEQLITFIQVLL